MSKKLWSVFTDDMDHCYFTGTYPVERHHIFGSSNRKNSEKYGFVIPLRPVCILTERRGVQMPKKLI